MAAPEVPLRRKLAFSIAEAAVGIKNTSLN
jgi:hypothetical protein